MKFTASHTVDTPRSNNDNTYDVYLVDSSCVMRVDSTMVETSTSARYSSRPIRVLRFALSRFHDSRFSRNARRSRNRSGSMNRTTRLYSEPRVDDVVACFAFCYPATRQNTARVEGTRAECREDDTFLVSALMSHAEMRFASSVGGLSSPAVAPRRARVATDAPRRPHRASTPPRRAPCRASPRARRTAPRMRALGSLRVARA